MKTFSLFLLLGLFGCSHMGMDSKEPVTEISLKLPMAKNKTGYELEKNGKLVFDFLMSNPQDKTSKMSLSCTIPLQVEVQGDAAVFNKALQKSFAPLNSKLKSETAKIIGKKKSNHGWFEIYTGFLKKDDKIQPLESGKLNDLTTEYAAIAGQPKDKTALFLSGGGVGFQLGISPEEAKNIKLILKAADLQEAGTNAFCDKIIKSGFQLKH